jgi:hypothetical protein
MGSGVSKTSPGSPAGPAAAAHADDEQHAPMQTEAGYELDCYPYTFSPLLLFAPGHYFDKGFSNYNSVASFFAPALDVNMVENVLYERGNKLYEDLVVQVVKNRMLVTCCIEAHFTAFQVISDKALIYYDPLNAEIQLVSGTGCETLIIFLLLKCNYADSQHIQEHKTYYTGSDANPTRRMIYKQWQKINTLSVGNLNLDRHVSNVSLNLDRYLLANNKSNPRTMSTQKTGNTCYFQCYLFALLCRVGQPSLARDGSSLDLADEEKLAEVTVDVSRFLLEFFVQDESTKNADGRFMRPLTNSNVVVDFNRYEEAAYYKVVTTYLRSRQLPVPDYGKQYAEMMRYFKETKTLHHYGRFGLEGNVSSVPNSKSLQAVVSTEDAIYKLARSNYYKVSSRGGKN